MNHLSIWGIKFVDSASCIPILISLMCTDHWNLKLTIGYSTLSLPFISFHPDDIMYGPPYIVKTSSLFHVHAVFRSIFPDMFLFPEVISVWYYKAYHHGFVPFSFDDSGKEKIKYLKMLKCWNLRCYAESRKG